MSVTLVHTNETAKQTQADWHKIENACREECEKPTSLWEFFGGIVTIEGRKYQVYGKP